MLRFNVISYTFDWISFRINLNGRLETSSTAFCYKLLEMVTFVKFLRSECLFLITEFKSTVSSSIKDRFDVYDFNVHRHFTLACVMQSL
jgi:hypothetical protein